MSPWDALAPAFAWRPSQAHLLELAGHVTDEQWHLCAPPGAGKTLIGLEIARRLARPTLVLSPTTAVRDQWCGSTVMFGADPDRFTTTDVEQPAPLLSITYQLIGNPGEASDALAAAARRLWVAELAVERDDAEARVAAIEASDPAGAQRERQARVRKLRRWLHDGGDLGVDRRELLGERADAWIDQLVARDIGCVVLDECHHLLDWWALVITELIARLRTTPDRSVGLIGLTATLPDPANERESANYTGLLGPVDAELHIPALVAEGALAPWCDAVHLVAPTADELAFLDDVEQHLARALDAHFVSEAFVAWAIAAVLGPALEDRLGDRARDLAADAPAWQTFWDRDPLTAAALAGWWAQRGVALPAGFAPPAPIPAFDNDARLRLVDAWFADPGHACPEPTRTEIRRVGERYGISFTSAGPQAGRSTVDVVASRSSAKGNGAAAVVAMERERRGDELRALVVVERDQATSPPAAARAVLGEDAGTAARMLAALVAHPTVVEAGVAAVTGRGAWADAVHADAIVHALAVTEGPQRWVEVAGTDIRGVVQLVGRGERWSSATWLAALRTLLTDGVIRTLVATRGLVGEGWDCPALNVLVDCSEAATRTTVTQLRGRAIRLDPAAPEKLASLWDVVVVHPSARREWQRLQRRHERWWGPDRAEGVSTGVEKVDERLVAREPLEPDVAAAVNAAAAARIAEPAAHRRAWATVDPAGDGRPTVVLRRAGAHPRSRTRVRTRRADWPRWRSAAAVGALGAVGTGLAATVLAVPLLWAPAGVAAVGAAAAAQRSRARVADEARTLVALGEAVRDGLAAGPVPALAGAAVTVQSTAAEVVLEVAAAEDHAGAWADAVGEALGPVGTPRWLVAVDERHAWRVPTAIGASRAAAESFAAAFAARVPAARLVRAGTPEATAVVLAQARIRPEPIDRRFRWRPPP